MDWNIRPLQGAGALDFGITPDEAANILGAPRRRIQRESGNTQEYRKISDPILTFDPTERLMEITFSKYVENVTFEGVDLFNDNWVTILNKIQAYDNALLDVMGTVVSTKLCVSLMALDSDDDDERSVSAIRGGGNDKYIGKYSRYIYRNA